MTTICIQAIGGQEQEVQGTRRNDLENRIDVLEGEMGEIDHIIDKLREYDIDVTKEELRDANVSDVSLMMRLDGLKRRKRELLHNLADIHNDLETRLRSCENELEDLAAFEEESSEEDTLWSTTETVREQDTMWSTEESQDTMWSSDRMWRL